MGDESGMQPSHRYPVIFNPKARSQKDGRVLHFIESHADRLSQHPTHHAGEAREIAACFAAAGEPVNSHTFTPSTPVKKFARLKGTGP